MLRKFVLLILLLLFVSTPSVSFANKLQVSYLWVCKCHNLEYYNVISNSLVWQGVINGHDIRVSQDSFSSQSGVAVFRYQCLTHGVTWTKSYEVFKEFVESKSLYAASFSGHPYGWDSIRIDDYNVFVDYQVMTEDDEDDDDKDDDDEDEFVTPELWSPLDSGAFVSVPSLEILELDSTLTTPPSVDMRPPAGPGSIELPPADVGNRVLFLPIPDDIPAPTWEYLEYKGGFVFPDFLFSKVYDELKTKIDNKLPMSWLSNFQEPSSSGSDSRDWKWRVEFDWYENHYGPWDFDFGEKWDKFVATTLARTIRLLSLVYVTIVTIIGILGLFFDSAI